MKILLVKPRPDAVQFGLAPFFQTEPLGLEYIAAELAHGGHSVTTVDLRFERRRFRDILARERPALVGIACLHILDAPATLRLADEVCAFDRGIFVLVGGHAASSYPRALAGSQSIAAILMGEGERTAAAVADALQNGRPLAEVPSLLVRSGSGEYLNTGRPREFLDLASVRPPDRSQVARYQKRYCCLNYMPVWTLETTRGCPHRCTFCSVWQFYRGSCRFHAPDRVRADFNSAGQNVFVIDDIFWADRERSEELANTVLTSRPKNWMLAQSRVDLVAANACLLERMVALARQFDIFFGFESPNRNRLDRLNKGTDIATTVEAIRVARELGYGVTGNFIVDPDFDEADFEALWSFLDEQRLYRVGFTILTPLPGTHYFEQMSGKLLVFDWSQYDLHHLLWRPRLPVERFFELYCETWRRSVLNLAGRKSFWNWLRAANPVQAPRLARILFRTQRLMDPQAYRDECRIPPAGGAA